MQRGNDCFAELLALGVVTRARVDETTHSHAHTVFTYNSELPLACLARRLISLHLLVRRAGRRAVRGELL